MQAVCLVIRGEVLEHILMSIFSYVFEICEQFVCHPGMVVKGSFIEGIPCQYPSGIIWNRSAIECVPIV